MRRTVASSLLLVALPFCATIHADSGLIVSRGFDLDLAIPNGGELLDLQPVDYGDATLSDVQVGLSLSGQSGPMVNGDWYAGLGFGEDGYAVLLNRPGKTASWPFGYLDNGINVLFDDQSPNGIHLY